MRIREDLGFCAEGTAASIVDLMIWRQAAWPSESRSEKRDGSEADSGRTRHDGMYLLCNENVRLSLRAKQSGIFIHEMMIIIIDFTYTLHIIQFQTRKT